VELLEATPNNRGVVAQSFYGNYLAKFGKSLESAEKLPNLDGLNACFCVVEAMQARPFGCN